MVFLALTRPGLDELARAMGRTPSPLWVNDGVLTAQELKELRQQGIDLTNFTHRFALDDLTAVADALDTIAMHHPGQGIWVEYPPIGEQNHRED